MAKDIKSGTLFKGKICGYGSRFFIKGYDCILSLDRENQGTQWEHDVTVYNYEPLDGYLDLEES